VALGGHRAKQAKNNSSDASSYVTSRSFPQLDIVGGVVSVCRAGFVRLLFFFGFGNCIPLVEDWEELSFTSFLGEGIDFRGYFDKTAQVRKKEDVGYGDASNVAAESTGKACECKFLISTGGSDEPATWARGKSYW